MFKFKFATDECEDDPLDTENVQVWKESKEILFDKDNKLIQELGNSLKPEIAKFNDFDMKYLNSNKVVELLKKLGDFDEVSALKADQNHSDLLPAVYEGGLKIWECTYDLLGYLLETNLNFKDKKVLDLGCGTGLVGIATLLKGSECCFQDYNEEVIRYITIPNILLNNKEFINQCNFYSGDWSSFSKLMQDRFVTEDDKFDYIFTSETIYNTESYSKLHQVFKNVLKTNGTIFLAAKLFYFGVGGGVTLFQEFLNRHKMFKYNTCWEQTKGVKRITIKIQFNT